MTLFELKRDINEKVGDKTSNLVPYIGDLHSFHIICGHACRTRPPYALCVFSDTGTWPNSMADSV